MRELDKDIVNIPGEKKEIEPGSFEEEKNQSEENSIFYRTVRRTEYDRQKGNTPLSK